MVKPLNVLIIEDDIVDRKLLCKLLSQSALSISDVKHAERLEVALDSLGKNNFDVVFLDLGLPDSHGIESFQAINTKAPNVPIIVLSGLDDAEMAITAVKQGVEDYLVKGQVDSTLLTRAVRYAIERKRTRKILDEKQKNIEAIFDAAPVGMMLIDDHMTVKRINETIKRMLKKDYQQIIDQHVGNSLMCTTALSSGKECGDSPHCEACKIRRAINTILDSQQSVYNIEAQLTLNIDDKKIDRWFSISGKPMITDDCTYAVIAINDITENKTAERERRLAEDKYRTIFENSAAAISLVDEQERLISWNKFTENLLGMDEKDLYLRPIQSLYPEGQWQKIREQNIREKGLQHHLETQMIKKNGELIDVDVSLSVLKSPEGKVMGSIGIITDITERKLAEKELKETMEIKSQFISTVSHELRTPLTSMKEAITIVSDEVAGKINKDQKHFLDIAKRNINRLSRLINEVLDFQKLAANKMKFDIQETDHREVVKDAYGTMLPYAKKKGVNLSIELDDNVPKARFDSDKIIQVLTNLVSNAIKSTPENGRVSVRTRHQGEDWVIQVSDTGVGIPKEALPKIFERFYRVHQPNQKIKGTGLGLAIVEKIVTAHGGRIEVESEVDKGTTFTVFLPLSPEIEPQALEETDELLENTIIDNQAQAK